MRVVYGGANNKGMRQLLVAAKALQHCCIAALQENNDIQQKHFKPERRKHLSKIRKLQMHLRFVLKATSTLTPSASPLTLITPSAADFLMVMRSSTCKHCHNARTSHAGKG
jgi:hypothetical protein